MSGPSPSSIASYVASLDSIQNLLASMPRRSPFSVMTRITEAAEHDIWKLTGYAHGEGGQYRLRRGRFRFRYDIERREVILYYCGLRREDTSR